MIGLKEFAKVSHLTNFFFANQPMIFFPWTTETNELLQRNEVTEKLSKKREKRYKSYFTCLGFPSLDCTWLPKMLFQTDKTNKNEHFFVFSCWRLRNNDNNPVCALLTICTFTFQTHLQIIFNALLIIQIMQLNCL